MEAVFLKVEHHENLRLASDDPKTQMMCRVVLQQGVTVAAVATQGAEGPICGEEQRCVSIFFQHVLSDDDDTGYGFCGAREPQLILSMSSSIMPNQG